MTGKLLIEYKHCGFIIPKEKRREHLKKVHKISTSLKGWISKHFKEMKWKYGWKKPAVIELD